MKISLLEQSSLRYTPTTPQGVCNYFAFRREYSRPPHHVRFRHSSEQSLAHYSSRPSETQLISVSDTISNAVENKQPQSTEISTITKAPLIQSSNRMASNVSMSTASASFSSGFFNPCNFQGNAQVFFGSQSRSDDKILVAFSVFCVRFVHFAVQFLLSFWFFYSTASYTWFKFDSGVILPKLIRTSCQSKGNNEIASFWKDNRWRKLAISCLSKRGKAPTFRVTWNDFEINQLLRVRGLIII